MPKIYTTLKLMNGDDVTIDEVNGGSYFQAALMAGHENVGNASILSLYLMAVVVRKNGDSVGIHYIKEIGMNDLSLITEAILSQTVNVKGNG